MENDVTVGYYIVIPQEVYLSVNPTTALVYGVIMSIVNYRNGACYASNEFIGDRIKISKRTVSDCVRTLKNEGFIKVEVSQNKETGLNYRKITPISTLITLQQAKAEKMKTKKKGQAIEPEWFDDYLKELELAEKAL
jgi:biotin operon repressor